MTKEVSIYLNFMRIIAAFLVVLFHFSYERFSNNNYNVYFGHEGVIIFFVLSGYVISYVADNKENNLKEYLMSRFSRLYSVVIPVILLVPLFDLVGYTFDYLIYEGKTEYSWFVFRLLSNITFTQEIWSLNIRYLSDGPLWSIGYEFWYYILFGFSMFLKGKKKYIFLITTVLIIGPKILLLLPTWLLGVMIYHYHKTKNLNKILARIFFIASPILFLCFFIYFTDINEYVYTFLGENIKVKLGFSNRFITDYITAFFIGLHIVSIKYLDIELFNKTLQGGEKLITFFADRTFSIYLFHFPLFLFFGAVLHHNPEKLSDILILFFITITSCFLLAEITEKKKYVYKKYISQIWEKIEKKVAT